MKRLSFIALVQFCLLVLVATVGSSQENRLLRFPAIHGDQIVFSYAGNLYTVGSTGGIARRLTSDIGFTMFPRFSPNGKWIAFTGQYDGNTEVYVMPAEGGVPRRITYTATLSRDDVSDRMGPNDIVMTWKNDSTIVYRSRMHEWNDFIGQLYEVPAQGGPSVQIPVPRGGFCSFSPDGRKMAYNRVFREFRTWKRYRGGQADEVWIYDFDTRSTTNVTNNPAQDIIPMWTGSRIYFVSDRDEIKRMNIYSHDLTTGETKKLTDFTEFDVKFPSLGDNAIVFENGGYIYRLDLATGESRRVPISIREDFVTGRGGLIDVSNGVTNYEISPDGKRALFGAHGEVFTVPEKDGNTRNLTNSSGVHERDSKWSPDGKWISFISDASGEDEVYIIPQNGSGPPHQLTKGADTYKYGPIWSPDSKKLLWSDKKLRLQYVDIESKTVVQVVQATAWEISNYNWSPDSKWIVYTKPEVAQMTTLYLYSLDKKESYPVTDGWFDSYGGAFSADGKYLFFISDRTFNPTWNQLEWNNAYVDLGGIFLITLAKETQSPFAPKSDEVSVGPTIKEEKKEEKKGKETQVTQAPVRVDLDGIQQRVASLRLGGSSYNHLASAGNRLYYTRNGSRDEKTRLLMYDLEKQKETELGEFNGFEISADGKKMLVGTNGTYVIIDLPTSKIEVKEKLDLSDMKMQLDRRAEWDQIFAECWRHMRDFFYAPNMQGVDWQLMRRRYAQLLPFVNHRADLTYIIGEMIGELSAGHTYVGGGATPSPQRIQTGQLGAVLEKDPASGYYRITRILKGQNWDKSRRSPLTEIGVDAREGDYIITMNGSPTNQMRDIYEQLVNTVDKQVTLTLNSQPRTAGSRTAVVVPIADERQLYYYSWVEGNIDKVSKATNGRVGYLHIPNMLTEGLNEFVKRFYPQLRKEALIVDVRGNGGGNVSPQIIERLRREIAMIDKARNAAVNPDPSAMILGPKVLLADEFSASDGDLVAYRFKKHRIGPVIGKRTWGGTVGIRGTLPLVDGGFLNRPEFASYDTGGKDWVVEGRGVEPDIVVENDPAKEFAGIDQQLNKAIEIITEEMKTNPGTLSPPPPYPDKSK